MSEQIVKPKNAASYTYTPSFTFDGNLPAEIFMKPSVATPALSDIFSIRQGIRTDEYLVLATEQSNVVKADTGCAPTYTASNTLSDRRISVSKLGIAQEWCKTDWEAVANQLTNDPSWMGDGLDGFQLTSKLQSFLTDALLDATRRDLFKFALFSNDTSGNADWNAMGEGLFVKLYDAFSSYCVKRVGNSFPNQFNSVLTAGQAIAALKACHVGANNRLKAIGNREKAFYVTQSVYENLLDSYEALTAGTSELQFKIIVDGVNQLTYRGIDVIPLPYADDLLEVSSNPWYNNLRHFVIYTPKASSRFSNLVIGTENASDLNRLQWFYDERLRTMYAQANFRMGVQFIHCDLTVFHD